MDIVGSTLIEGFEENTVIYSIGDFFKRQRQKNWQVNLTLWPKQKNKSLSINQVPMLARRRIINSTDDIRKLGNNLTLTIPKDMKWYRSSPYESPALKKDKQYAMEASQLCVSGISTCGIHFSIPQFELARALFFHSAYLSRAALEESSLNLDFDIHVLNDNQEAEIRALVSSGIALDTFSNYGSMRHLAWVLLDQDARSSFESIYQYHKKTQILKKEFYKWCFQFDPPKLDGVVLKVIGQYDKESKSIYVHEVLSIDHISHGLPSEITLIHPLLTENIQGSSAGQRAPTQSQSQEFQIKDETVPNSDTNQRRVRSGSVSFGFNNPFNTTVAYQNKSVGNMGRIDEEVSSDACAVTQDVSTDEGSILGNIPGAEYDQTEDISDDAHLFESKFSCFLQIFDLLVKNYGCQTVSKNMIKLKKYPYCRKHLMKSGDPRYLAAFLLRYCDQNYLLLEVDTSDAVNQIATKLFRIDHSLSNEFWDDLLEMLLTGSLRWPAEFLNKSIGNESHVSIVHPRAKAQNKGVLDPDCIYGWAEKVFFLLKNFELKGIK